MSDETPAVTPDQFVQHLEQASKDVAKMPAWKQELLGGEATKPEPTTYRLESLLNKAAVKRFTMEQAAKLRAHKFTRMSPMFLTRVEADLKESIKRRIMSLPSVGKTIQ